jgi:hypothetical protein
MKCPSDYWDMLGLWQKLLRHALDFYTDILGFAQEK